MQSSSKMKFWTNRAQSLPRIYPSGWLLCLGFTVTGVAVTVLGSILPVIIQRWPKPNIDDANRKVKATADSHCGHRARG
jgi:hypothetical protein